MLHHIPQLYYKFSFQVSFNMNNSKTNTTHLLYCIKYIYCTMYNVPQKPSAGPLLTLSVFRLNFVIAQHWLCVNMQIFSLDSVHFNVEFFSHSIDATNSERIARFVNDAPDGSHLNNCVMKMVMVENYPRLCLFANREIKKGEELRYDYGDPNVPWRQVCHKFSCLAIYHYQLLWFVVFWNDLWI